MSSKKEILSDLLKGLEEEGDVEGSAIVTRDGLLIASGLPEDIDSETFAAMSATMLGAAETAVCELKKDEVGIIIVEGKEAKLITRNAGLNAFLVAMVSTDANLGLILIEMSKVSKEIEKEME